MSPRRRKCSHCREPSISGLIYPLCQYHYDVVQFGKTWADHCSPGASRRAMHGTAGCDCTKPINPKETP